MHPLGQNGLTRRQDEVFIFISRFYGSNGFAPSLREIGEGFRIAPSSVLEHLRALERKGFIRRVPQKPRCIEIKKKAPGA